ncbi:hypothetical protein HT574_06610 [Parageobacillus sp. VR-IP]|uniref:hypothetical protein n=1 Tax=Parageobacillus sp. VR-IP TaxID=2742205 RepID=UPI00158276B8|nr:hypothetical protein [Parageobacillus sp. VR-IP]NUK29767.1 hypothetical protein [Parageobacillus sp. VR-IP]
MFKNDRFFIKKVYKSIKQGKLADDNKSESRIETKAADFLSICESIIPQGRGIKKFQGGKEDEN